ncbi:MAG: YbaY family lipoprotein [Phormidesmis sp.]
MKALPAERYTVSGRLHYPENFALPSDAIATVTLTDVSALEDSSATMLVRQVIHPPHQQLSVPFALTVDATDIDERHLYTIQARVASAGRVILTNASTYPVITLGNPTTVEVHVR